MMLIAMSVIISSQTQSATVQNQKPKQKWTFQGLWVLIWPKESSFSHWGARLKPLPFKNFKNLTWYDIMYRVKYTV